jgi:hypothetical protein
MPTEADALANILNMLGQLPLIGVFKTDLVAYALLNAAHILFLGMLMWSILPLDLGILRAPGFAWTVPVTAPLRRLAIIAFLGAALTGLLLFSVRSADYLGNRVFLAKIAVIAAAGTNALLYERLRNQAIRRAQAGLSLAMWLSALFAGRFIGFV